MRLTRATKGLPNAAVLHPFNCTIVMRSTFFASRKSSSSSREDFIQSVVSQRGDQDSDRRDESSGTQEARRLSSRPYVRTNDQGDQDMVQHIRPEQDLTLSTEIRMRPKEMANVQMERVGFATSTVTRRVGPFAILSEQPRSTRPSALPRESVLVRRQKIKPLPTVVTFFNLCKSTTIEDVLLSIREAALAGKVGTHECRIADARIRSARTRNKDATDNMTARVEFVNSFGAQRVHRLSLQRNLQIRGVVPSTKLELSRGTPKKPFAGTKSFFEAKEVTAVAGASMDTATSEARRYLDYLKVKDNIVRKTHLNYNRVEAAAAADEAELRINVDFKSILDRDGDTAIASSEPGGSRQSCVVGEPADDTSHG